ncbi:MAG: hypothetical protein H6707_07860 [Deltaproteobacteria bacterium]|nr:hypothetical protein [Deltaproteobacteria bacterium]
MRLLLDRYNRGAGRKTVQRVLLGCVVLLALLVVCYATFRAVTRFSPPRSSALAKVSVLHRAAGQPIALNGSQSTLRRDRGIWLIELHGDPASLGRDHGLLVQRQADRFEQHMKRLLERHAPGWLRRFIAGNVVRWRYRHLDEATPEERQIELAALAGQYIDSEDYLEEPFQRLLYYHALYEVSRDMADSPLLACTSFAAWGKATQSGALLVGRNFDFDGGEPFDRDKALIIFRQTGKIPFASVAWPTMTGVVTGVNAHGIFVAIHAAKSDAKLSPGAPVVFLLRKILAEARSLDDARRIAKAYPLSGTQALLLADGQRKQAGVLEIAGERQMWRTSERQYLLLTNHLRHARFRSDATNDRHRRYSTSGARYQRLEELVKGRQQPFDPPAIAQILRDRRGAGNRQLPLGHASAINALGTTHSVVLDLSAMVLWVSRGPHTQGVYVPFDLRRLLLDAPEVRSLASLPAQPLALQELSLHRWATEQRQHAERLLALSEVEGAIDHARRACQLAPQSPQMALHLADLLYGVGRTAQARDAYRRFLGLHPPYLADVERAQSRLAGH